MNPVGRFLTTRNLPAFAAPLASGDVASGAPARPAGDRAARRSAGTFARLHVRVSGCVDLALEDGELAYAVVRRLRRSDACAPQPCAGARCGFGQRGARGFRTFEWPQTPSSRSLRHGRTRGSARRCWTLLGQASDPGWRRHREEGSAAPHLLKMHRPNHSGNAEER